MKKIIISPYSRKLRNNKENAKNYPYFSEVIKELNRLEFWLIQIGTGNEHKLDGINEYQFDLPLKKLKELILECDTWISVDNFMGHLGAFLGKKGVVIFGKSDPEIFGYPQNINLLKDRKYLREKQFAIWEEEEFNPIVFVKPNDVVEAIKNC